MKGKASASARWAAPRRPAVCSGSACHAVVGWVKEHALGFSVCAGLRSEDVITGE